MYNLEEFDEKSIVELKKSLKTSKMTKEQLQDQLFVEILKNLSTKDRWKVLAACMLNKTFQRIRYRKCTK